MWQIKIDLLIVIVRISRIFKTPFGKGPDRMSKPSSLNGERELGKRNNRGHAPASTPPGADQNGSKEQIRTQGGVKPGLPKFGRETTANSANDPP